MERVVDPRMRLDAANEPQTVSLLQYGHGAEPGDQADDFSYGGREAVPAGQLAEQVLDVDLVPCARSATVREGLHNRKRGDLDLLGLVRVVDPVPFTERLGDIERDQSDGLLRSATPAVFLRIAHGIPPVDREPGSLQESRERSAPLTKRPSVVDRVMAQPRRRPPVRDPRPEPKPREDPNHDDEPRKPPNGDNEPLGDPDPRPDDPDPRKAPVVG